jgi:hypothetical protein
MSAKRTHGGKRTFRLQPLLSPPGRMAGAKVALAGMVLVFVLHSCSLALLFHPVSGLFDTEPVMEQDWGLHAYHLSAMEKFWQQDGRLWGYSPSFMAGYPSNTIQDISIKLYELLALLASALGLNIVLAFKLIVFLFAAAVPWMMFWAARNFFEETSHPPLIGLLAALLGTAYWWNSLPREMFFYGMIGFPPASYALILSLSFLYRALRSKRLWTWAHYAWAVSLAIMLPLHLQAAILLVMLAIVLLVVCRDSVTGTGFLSVLAGAVLAVVVNLFWLIPLFNHRGDDVSSSLVTQLPLFLSADPLTFIRDYLSPASYWSFRVSVWEKGWRWLLLILGLSGMVRLVRSDRRDLGSILIIAAAALFALTYFGSLVSFFKGWQPLRFKVPYDLCWVLPASFVLSLWRPGAWSRTRSIFFSLLLTGAICTFLVNVVQTEANPRLRLRTRLTSPVNEILDWIRNKTSKEARMLFEESGDETGFIYDGMYLSSFIPRMTGRQLIGGPINLYNDRHHFAELHSAQLFKRDIATFTDQELASYFRAYNIGAAVVFHPRTIQRLLALPALVSVDQKVGSIHLMRINQPPNWFLAGEGEAKAEWNRIEGSNVRGSGIILKYHWVKGLVSSPPMDIEAVKVLDDPIPFVKIPQPLPQFVLHIGR